MTALFQIDVDTSAAADAFRQLPEAVRRHTLEACRHTALSIVREAKARLSRQLGPNATGKTVAGIDATPARNGDGYLLLVDREPLANLPLWLEKGTAPGKRRNFARTPARPYFYSSIALEVGRHERRMDDALREAAADTGLGD